MNWDTASIYAACCGTSGGFICARSKPECPEVPAPPRDD
jgi:hypothetical protein